MFLVRRVLRAHVFAHSLGIYLPLLAGDPDQYVKTSVGPPVLGPVGPAVYDCKPYERMADALSMMCSARNTATEAYAPMICHTPCDDRLVRATPWTLPDPCPIPAERTTPWQSQGTQLQYDLQTTQHNVVLTAQLSRNLHRKWERTPPPPLPPRSKRLETRCN